MKLLIVYLQFDGRCEEALGFYKNTFGGEIISMKTYSESPVEHPLEHAKLIMHAEFKAEGIHFMACDVFQGKMVSGGNSINLNILLDSVKTQEKIFSKLSKGGEITMPLQDTFWGARYGMLTDQFGINWMLNVDL